MCYVGCWRLKDSRKETSPSASHFYVIHIRGGEKVNEGRSSRLMHLDSGILYELQYGLVMLDMFLVNLGSLDPH